MNIIIENFGGSFSIGGTMFVETGARTSTVIRHEWGHTVQERLLGPSYITSIFIPSVTFYSILKERKWIDRRKLFWIMLKAD